MQIDYLLVPLTELLSSEEYSGDILLNGINNFKCELENDLEYFLKEKAIKKEMAGTSRTYLFLDEKKFNDDEISIMAFISIAHTTLDLSGFSKKQRKKILGSSVDNRDNLESCHSYLIGQLGRSSYYSKENLSGDQILFEAINILNELKKQSGGDLVILECRPHMFEKFYSKRGFSKMPLIVNVNFDVFIDDLFRVATGGKKDPNILEMIEDTYGEDIQEEVIKCFGEQQQLIDKVQKDDSTFKDTLLFFSYLKSALDKVFAEKNAREQEELLTVYHRLSKIEFDFE